MIPHVPKVPSRDAILNAFPTVDVTVILEMLFRRDDRRSDFKDYAKVFLQYFDIKEDRLIGDYREIHRDDLNQFTYFTTMTSSHPRCVVVILDGEHHAADIHKAFSTRRGHAA